MTDAPRNLASYSSMIVHFMRDEKVIENIINNYSAVGGNHIFLIFTRTPQKELNYISRKTLAQANVIKYDFEAGGIEKYVKEAKAILLHSLHYIFAKTLNEITADIKVGWIAWGFDIYTLPKISSRIYAPLTDKFIKESRNGLSIERFIKNNQFLDKLYYKIVKGKTSPNAEINRAMAKIDYFITYLEEDYHLFSKYYPNVFEFKYCSFSDIGQYLAGNENLKIDLNATNILVGNSNTPECNHLDVFQLLEKDLRRFEVSKVYVPLSYGSNERYRSKVKQFGTQVMSEYFEPLEIFMKRDEYVEILQSCSTGIFYHYRQQALGNIISMLYLGARVYMSPISPAYQYLTRNGLIVFDLEQDFRQFGNRRLDSVSVAKNRTILDSLFSKQRVLADLEALNAVLCR